MTQDEHLISGVNERESPTRNVRQLVPRLRHAAQRSKETTGPKAHSPLSDGDDSGPTAA